MTVDGFYTKEGAEGLSCVVFPLNKEQTEFGRDVPHFNMVPENANELFSKVLGRNVEVIDEQSGVFRFPELFVHFEGFDSVNEWLFVVAIQQSTFNIFEHKTGATNATEGYKFNYQNLFEWDLTVNHLLQPGQGVFFRPWLFHSFDTGLIQIFRLIEKT